MGRQRKFTPWLAGITALIALAILLFPVYAVIVGSFENNAQLLGSHYNFLPPTPTLANYRTVLSQQGGHILSSLIIGLATALLTLAIALPAAHALARYRFRATVGVVASLLVAQILPSIVIANSLFVVYHKLHLLNSYPGLILADASYAVPFSKVSAKMKSPHPFRKANSATVMMADRLIGRTIRTNVPHSLAPSTRAACRTSAGRPSMKARMTRMLNGTA
jgi:ABC-type glycerol-3-phosphate transport system permease component